MHEIFTPEKEITISESDKKESEMTEFTPRESTIEFIKQFARAYCCGSSANNGLCGFVAN